MYNIYKELNKVISYIEQNILNDIEIKNLSRIIGFNETVLQNVFTCLTGISIHEYIRRRRLSLAANDIINGKSITEVSYQYLYSSPSSFHRAFKAYKGVSPSEIKKNPNTLKLYNRITFQENIKNYQLEYKIYKNRKFQFYGKGYDLPLNNIPKLTNQIWKEVKRKNPIFCREKRYGFLQRIDTYTGKYYCLLDKEYKEFEKIIIPKHHYLSYRIDNLSSKEISDSIKKGVEEYITSLNYHKIDSPNIEIYHSNDIEILIPVS